MSGSNAIPPIRLTLDGKDAVERGMEDIARAAERMGQRTAASAQQVGTLASVADDVGGRLGTLATRAQAASAVLDRMGAGAAAQGLATLSTVLDGVALASSRVSANAIAGEAAVSGFFARMATGATVIGAVAAGLQAAGLGINAAGEGALRAADYNSRYQQTLESLNAVLGVTAERAQAAALALWRTNQQAALSRVEQRLGETFEGRSANVTEYNQNQAALAAARDAVARAEARAGRGGLTAASALPGLRERVQQLEARNSELVSRNAQFDRDEAERVARINDLNRQQGPDDFIGPPGSLAPTTPRGGSGGGGGGRAPTPRDSATGYTAAVQARLDRVREAEEREAQRTADREARDLERREDRNNRVTDRIVDYSAERFAELFDKNGRGWEGMLETLERTAKSTIARIAAELVLRPIIAPVVSALGLGALGAGNGGFSGLGGLGGGGGGGDALAGGGGGTGGITQLLGLARSGYSAYSSLSGGGSSGGWLGGISGIVNNPIWTSGGGFFGAGAVSSGGFLPAGATSLPAMSSATTGVGGIGGTLGSVSLGTYAAGIGLGYGAGTLIGNSIARTDAQRTNVQIGSGAGAVSGALAGAAIGSVIPGIGTAAGALIGGLLGGGGGGALGGIIGPSNQFSGGDVGIGVGPDGLLRVTGAGGKRFDSAAATEQTQQQLDQINAALRLGGVTIGGMGGGTLGWSGFGQSGNVFGPTEIFNRVRSNLSSTNANLNQVLGSGRIDSFDELSQVSSFITQLYEPLSKARDYTKEYADAIGAQLQVYEQSIAKARELGLAEAGLVAARDQARFNLLEQRDASVHGRGLMLTIAGLRQSGNARDAMEAARLEFGMTSAGAQRELRDFLRGAGYGDETSLFQDYMARFQALLPGMRRDALDAARDQATGSGRSLMEDLTVGGLGGISPSARYAAGLRVLEDARASGSLDRLSAAARNVLPVARDYLGTSERYGALVADISRDIRRLGGDPVGLGSFLEGQARGNDALERIYGLSNSQLSELKGMRAEINRLNAVLTTLMQRR